jgi:hypothetical protein
MKQKSLWGSRGKGDAFSLHARGSTAAPLRTSIGRKKWLVSYSIGSGQNWRLEGRIRDLSLRIGLILGLRLGLRENRTPAPRTIESRPLPRLLLAIEAAAWPFSLIN